MTAWLALIPLGLFLLAIFVDAVVDESDPKKPYR